jgi:hypothetical protein
VSAQSAENTRPLLPGDLIFFSCHGPLLRQLPEHLVCWATHGPYPHVGIVRSPTESIEALAYAGVVRHPLPSGYAAVAYTSQRLSEKGLGIGLAWLDRKVAARSPYSPLDLVMDGVRAFLPRAWSGTPFLVAPGRFDCSELATRFLLIAGFDGLPDALLEEPSLASPNDLARALGLLPPRRA